MRFSAALSLFVLLPLGCAKTEPPGEEKTPPAPVKVEEAKADTLPEWTDLLGMTQPLPDKVARISAPIEGRVVSLLRDGDNKALLEGQPIEAGTVVAQLDTRIINEQLKQADFAVKQAVIEVKRLEALSASAAVAGQTPLVSRIELERARLTLEDAQSKQKALAEQAKLYTLTSPIPGRLGLVQAVQGQTLAVGAPVVEVIDLSEIDVLCYVPPHVVAHLELGQPARLANHAEEEKADEKEKPKPRVVFIAQQAQPDTGNFAVKVRFPNPESHLRANAVVSIQVQTEPAKKRLMLPESAVMEDQDPPGVVVVREDPKDKLLKAHRLRVEIGIRDREKHRVEIVALKEDPDKDEKLPIEGVRFVTEGGNGLHDDDVVKIEEEKENK